MAIQSGFSGEEMMSGSTTRLGAGMYMIENEDSADEGSDQEDSA